MPIQWSAVQVMEAADMMEKHIDTAIKPLELARESATTALEISNLPDYMKSRIASLVSEINRAIGVGQERRGSMLKSRLKAIRDDVPKEALEAEKKDRAYGERPSLV